MAVNVGPWVYIYNIVYFNPTSRINDIDRTSFCVVSLAARTARGRAAIRAAGWESARDPSTSIFLPQDPTVLFQVHIPYL